MDFVRSYFFTNETLGNWTLERHFFKLSECLSNVLTVVESEFDERNVQLIRGSLVKK